MRVLVTTRAGSVVKVKRNDFVFSAGGSYFMAFGASNGGVRSGERELGLPVLGDGKQRTVPIRYRMAALAAVLERRFRKLAVVRIFLAVRTEIGRAHVLTPVTVNTRMPSSSCEK